MTVLMASVGAGRRLRPDPRAGHRGRQGLVDRVGRFPDWFTKDIQLAPRRPGPGMKAAIVGTCIITVTATVIAVPLGIAGAVYLNEYGRTRLFARVLRFLANVMAGVPSIVMGLFIYVFWVVPRGVDGLNGFGGALALACLMLPIVVRSSEEMLRLVPQNLRDASYALGGSTSRTTLRVVLPRRRLASSAAACWRSPAPPARPRR